MNAHTLVAISTFVAASALGAQKAPDVTPYLIADRAAEVALARTAAPSDVSEKATVLVLTPKGYTEAARGTNGFTCIVMRSFAGSDLLSSPRATPRLTSPVDQPWGFREFSVIDPDGNLLRCLEPLGMRKVGAP